MDPENIGKVADAVKATADAVSVPDEVKVEVLKPGATSMGEVFQSLIDLTLGTLIERGIIKRAKINSLQQQAVKFYQANPDASYDDAKAMLLVKEVEDSKFSIENDEMRTRFAKLIANTANKKTNQAITPLFSTVLSNLSPESASALEFLAKQVYTPAIWLKVHNQQGGTIEDSQIAYGTNVPNFYLSNGVLDQLSSLGLILLQNGVTVSSVDNKDKDYYVGLTNFIDIMYAAQRTDKFTIGKSNGVVSLTHFGKEFVKAVS